MRRVNHGQRNKENTLPWFQRMRLKLLGTNQDSSHQIIPF